MQPKETGRAAAGPDALLYQDGYECWELDALEPQAISDLIQSNVELYRDEDLYQSCLAKESTEKGLLYDLSENWEHIAENWTEIKEGYCY